jgi:arylsulfatase A-like enzyme
MDIAQTILDYVGVQGIKDMQGQTMKPLLDNEDSNNTWRNSLYYHYNEFPGNQMVAKHYGIRTSQHKLIHFYQFDEWEFYDLQKDPSESENAYASEAYRPQIEKMKELLLQDRKKYLDQSDISIMPEEWRKIYRGPEARKE